MIASFSVGIRTHADRVRLLPGERTLLTSEFSSLLPRLIATLTRGLLVLLVAEQDDDDEGDAFGSAALWLLFRGSVSVVAASLALTASVTESDRVLTFVVVSTSFFFGGRPAAPCLLEEEEEDASSLERFRPIDLAAFPFFVVFDLNFLLLTADREVVLIDPVECFAAVVDLVRSTSTDGVGDTVAATSTCT